MNIENFNWDKQNQIVSWTYNGKIIKLRYENMNFANYNLRNNYVIVIVGKNFNRDQLYYLSFEGKQIFAFDQVNGKISWQYDNQTIDIHCKNAEDAQIYFNNNLVMTIISISRTDKRIRNLKRWGEKIIMILNFKLIDINKQIDELKQFGIMMPIEVKVKAIEYLKSGLTIAACAGFAKDEFDAEKGMIFKTPLTQTDSEWTWSSLLIYYIENYNIPLPEEFISHMESNSWIVDKEKAKSIVGLPDINDK